jgi:hypothetical protein
MPATPIPITVAPFQGGENGTDIVTLLAGSVIAATTEMQFVNDGYSVLFVTTGAVTPNITISSVPDNAGREGPIGPIALTANVTRAYGPFRPIWWNQAGVVNVTFSNAANVKVAVVKFQF